MRSPTTPSSIARSAVGILLVLVVGACSSDPTETAAARCEGPGTLGDCPAWDDFSPPVPSMAPVADPTSIVVEEESGDLERIDEDGELLSLGNVTFVCTTEEYDFVDNPDEALAFGIDQTVIWPGGLIQGRSHRDATSDDGVGGLLELPIRDRAPVEVFMSFNNDRSDSTVVNPTAASVGAAVKSLIGNAEAEGLATSNKITFSQETYSSQEQAARAFGVSGRYLGFEASASGSVSSSVSTNIVAAQFKQEMYQAGVTQPATPQAFFGEDADAAFQTQVALGNVGPGNPPLYVSRIGYGRMMVFAMSAKAEANAIKGALSASYEGIGAGGSANLSARESAILETAELRISQIGGDQGNALAAIRSGQLSDYFTDIVPLTAAEPLWFELKSLTGEVAMVSEPGTFTQTTCTPKLPGTFDYSDEQNLSVPFSAGTERTTLQADVNGDGRMDLVFNERRTSPALNQVHVAIADAGGTFALQGPWAHPVTSPGPAEGWENFEILSADVDGDGRADLIWNALTATTNAVYTALSTGDGNFFDMPRQEKAPADWSQFNAAAGDIDGDGKADLVWSNAGALPAQNLRTNYALAQNDSTLFMGTTTIVRSSTWQGYAPPVLAQLDGTYGLDWLSSVVFSTRNSTYAFLFAPTSDTEGGYTEAYWDSGRNSGWANYAFRVGNIDGANGADQVWVDVVTGKVERALNNGDGSFGPRITPVIEGAETLTNAQPFLADFNNDGRDDLLMMQITSDTNRLIAGFGSGDGEFSFPAGVQTHPASPAVGWEPFDDIFVGDVDGDGKADIVWTNTQADAQIYVALSK